MLFIFSLIDIINIFCLVIKATLYDLIHNKYYIQILRLKLYFVIYYFAKRIIHDNMATAIVMVFKFDFIISNFSKNTLSIYVDRWNNLTTENAKYIIYHCPKRKVFFVIHRRDENRLIKTNNSARRRGKFISPFVQHKQTTSYYTETRVFVDSFIYGFDVPALHITMKTRRTKRFFSGPE